VVAAIKASDGSVLWSHLFGGALDQMCTSAALDDNGNAIFAGTYAGVLDFGPGALSPAPTGAQDMILWVAKFNGATGATMAAKAFGTTGKLEADGLASDAQGNVILSGSLFAPVTFEARRSRRSEQTTLCNETGCQPSAHLGSALGRFLGLGHRRERGRGLKWKCNRRGPVQPHDRCGPGETPS